MSYTIWRRATPNFFVSLSYEYDDDCDLSWDETGETVAAIQSGEMGCYVFCVSVQERGGAEIGVSYLGGSIYADPREFMDHRLVGRSNRQYAAEGSLGRCGSYFKDMLHEAISEARKTYSEARPHLRQP